MYHTLDYAVTRAGAFGAGADVNVLDMYPISNAQAIL
jgi:hypothetical protein